MSTAQMKHTAEKQYDYVGYSRKRPASEIYNAKLSLHLWAGFAAFIAAVTAYTTRLIFNLLSFGDPLRTSICWWSLSITIALTLALYFLAKKGKPSVTHSVMIADALAFGTLLTSISGSKPVGLFTFFMVIVFGFLACLIYVNFKFNYDNIEISSQQLLYVAPGLWVMENERHQRELKEQEKAPSSKVHP